MYDVLKASNKYSSVKEGLRPALTVRQGHWSDLLGCEGFHHANRYLVNVIDHETNYCRNISAKTKDEGAKFMNFVGHFHRHFDCRLQVFRNDGAGEYTNLDLFCERNGVVRQRTEADHSASNRKAERMQSTVLNMSRYMRFNCRSPMHFWEDAVQYAVAMHGASSIA
jgi:hypothetical protein